MSALQVRQRSNKNVQLRVSGAILLLNAILYGLLVLAPFYANGIHHIPENEIKFSDVDVLKQPPFSWPWIGGSLWMVSLFAAALGPLVALASGIGLFWGLIQRWSSLPVRERVFWITIAALAAVMFIVTWSDGSRLATWFVD